MKKIKLLNVLGATLLATITLTMPIVLVSCGQTETGPSALEQYKRTIYGQPLKVDQKAIDMLGTELYRHENGYNVLDLSHWGIGSSYGLDVFTKPVDKIIIPNHMTTIPYTSFFPKLTMNDIGKQLLEVYPEFALKGHCEINFSDIGKIDVHIVGLMLSDNYIIQETDDMSFNGIFTRKLNAFPMNAFRNVSKITLNTKKNYIDDTVIEHASLPYAFLNVDKNDPELVEYNGKKYPGIIAQKEFCAQSISAIIPYTTNPTDSTNRDSRFLNFYTVNRQWPGFVKSDKTLGNGFYYAPLHDESLKVFFTTLEDVNQFFGQRYDVYANMPANLSNAHIQKNYQTLLKIFPHKDSTPQNPKIDWFIMQPLYNNK